MGTVLRGTFVISWSQTDVDGVAAAPVESLMVGSAWSWRGEAVRVDGPAGILRLGDADGEVNVRRSAARKVRRLIGAALTHTTDLDAVEVDDTFADSTFVVTDGTRSFTVTLIETGTGAAPLLMFVDDMPPRRAELWVVHHALDQRPGRAEARAEGGVICFTPGTLIDTPDGPRLIDHLNEGDFVMTKDNGPQEILWKGARRMTGARLFAMPHLRPIRIRTGAFGVDRPDNELLVSPQHRMVVRGDVARALFNTDEVLVAARDMVNGQSVCVDMHLREVTYIHVMLSDHQVLWANGIETESFHPANTALSTLDPEDRLRLLAGFPDLEFDAQLYGGYARRNLSDSEAAILMHEAA